MSSYVEQNARVAPSVCDRSSLMEKGSIVFQGSGGAARQPSDP